MSRRSGFTFAAGATPELLMKRLSDLGKIAEHSGKAGLWEVGHAVMEGAKDRAPERTGALVDSIAIDPPTPEGMAHRRHVDISAGPVYGPSGVDYAVLMHEGVPPGHRYTLGTDSRLKNTGAPHVGRGVGWKFLERAFESAYRQALRTINARIKAALAARFGGTR